MNKFIGLFFVFILFSGCIDFDSKKNKEKKENKVKQLQEELACQRFMKELIIPTSELPDRYGMEQPVFGEDEHTDPSKY